MKPTIREESDIPKLLSGLCLGASIFSFIFSYYFLTSDSFTGGFIMGIFGIINMAVYHLK